jgi:hypothetical protein
MIVTVSFELPPASYAIGDGNPTVGVLAGDEGELDFMVVRGKKGEKS